MCILITPFRSEKWVRSFLLDSALLQAGTPEENRIDSQHLDKFILVCNLLGRAWHCLDYFPLIPAGAWIVAFLQNAPFFARAISSRSARRAWSPAEGVAQHAVVLNVVNWLMSDRVKVLAWRLAIVTQTLLLQITIWKSTSDTPAEIFYIFIIGVVAKIDIDIEKIKGVRSEEAAERNEH